MMVRKTLAQIKAEGGGRFDKEKFDSFTDENIERMIDEDPDLAPRTETLMPYFQARNVREKLGLSQQQFAKKLGLSVAAVKEWERSGTPTEPELQASLHALCRFKEVRVKAHDLLAKTLIYFYEHERPINEIIFVPSAIFVRIIGTHDSIGWLLEGGHSVDAAVIALAQFELRVELAWAAHDIKNASKWVSHSDEFNTPERIIRAIKELYTKPSDERSRLCTIFSHLSGVKHANPVMSELVFDGRPAEGGFTLSTGTIEDEFSKRFAQLLRDFSIYQMAWSSHVMSLFVAKYAAVEQGLREQLRLISREFERSEVELAAFMEEVTKRQRGFFGLRKSREARRPRRS